MKFTESQIDELEQTGVVRIESPLEGVIYSGGMYRHGRSAWSERTLRAQLPLVRARSNAKGATLIRSEAVPSPAGWLRVDTWRTGSADEDKPSPVKKPCCEKCKKGGKPCSKPGQPPEIASRTRNR